MSAAHPLVRSSAHERNSPRLEHTIHLTDGAFVCAFLRQLHYDIKARDQIKGRIRERQFSDRGLNGQLLNPLASEFERVRREIHPDDFTCTGVAPQPRHVAPGATSGVENYARDILSQERVKYGCGDLSHPDKPPELLFELE